MSSSSLFHHPYFDGYDDSDHNSSSDSSTCSNSSTEEDDDDDNRSNNNDKPEPREFHHHNHNNDRNNPQHHLSSSSSSSLTTTGCLSPSQLWNRIIVHLDVDCFYCQCEQVDGPPDYRHRPLAIGQKHIIVTSNYVARSYGVKKLQTREAAYAACPSLLILEGSDLERYRKHSRRIYLAFRQGFQNLWQSPTAANEQFPKVPVRRGGMDENFADITALVNHYYYQKKEKKKKTTTSTTVGVQEQPFQQRPDHTFVYGDNASAVSVLVEDQTGATASVSHGGSSSHTKQSFSWSDTTTTTMQQYYYNVHAPFSQSSRAAVQRNVCQERLDIAAAICEQVRQSIYHTTGFTTTLGISVSKLLAKLASDLHKPNSLNVLYPWRSASVLLPMPLQKIPNLGRATLQSLQPCLLHAHASRPKKDQPPQEQEERSSPPAFWTCRDLLQVPQSQIQSCLQQPNKLRLASDTSHQASVAAAERQATQILNLCRGWDPTPVLDDDGGLTKQVSVEDSFRRGTNVTAESVHQAMHALSVRLPKLLRERQASSHAPHLAYPTTLRLTVRVVDPNAHDAAQQCQRRQQHDPHQRSRRPFLTHSKQCPFDGKAYLRANPEERPNLLAKAVEPMLYALVLHKSPPHHQINVTRMNLAAAQFQDLPLTTTSSSSPASTPLSSRNAMQKFFSSQSNHSQEQNQNQDNQRRPVASQPVAKQVRPSLSSTLPSRAKCSSLLFAPQATLKPKRQKSCQSSFGQDRSCPSRLLSNYEQSTCPSLESSQHGSAASVVVGGDPLLETTTTTTTKSCGIDPSVLAELPADIRAEVLEQHQQQHCCLDDNRQDKNKIFQQTKTTTRTTVSNKNNINSRKRKGTIDFFFARKK
ncbi:hypothetical protein ACA910_015689 [Epithemia clementina (nom. ined.)]